jgi:hypothetical protein
MKRRSVLAAGFAATLTMSGVLGAFAQDATPEAAGPFASLGLPELTISATDDGFTVDQEEIPAGRYLVRLENGSANPMLATGFVQLIDGVTLDDLSMADEIASGTPIPEMGPDPSQFDFLYDVVIVPGASAISPEVVVDIPAGDYGIWPDDPTSEWAAIGLTVTGDPEAAIEGPEPEAAVTIIEEGEGGVGYTFRIEGELAAGPQVVKVLNASDQPHFVEAWTYPEEITLDQVMGTMMFDPSTGATPGPDMLDFEKMSMVGWASVQSTGTTQWVVMDLSAGQVVLACWIPDNLAGGIPHALDGMIDIFEVVE